MGRTVILLDCEDAPKWEGYGIRLWKALLAAPEDSAWLHFRPPLGTFPPLAVVQSAHLMVITGSRYSAYEHLPWIEALAKDLPKWVATGVHIIACCFGHQLIARALGGAVTPNPSRRFVLGIEAIHCRVPDLRRCGLLSPLAAALPHAATSQLASNGDCEGTACSNGSSDPGGGAGAGGGVLTMRQLESHGDCVATLPPGAVLLATSGSAAHEMWGLGSNVLAFQFHPEMTPSLAQEKILGSLTESGRLSSSESGACAASLASAPPDVPAMAAVLRHFARHGLQGQETAPPRLAASGSAERELFPLAAPNAPADVEHAVSDLVAHTRAAFEAGLGQTHIDVEQLIDMTQLAASSCAAAADRAEHMAARVTAAKERASSVQRALDTTLPQLEALLDGMAKLVDSLDEQSKALEADVAAVCGVGR